MRVLREPQLGYGLGLTHKYVDAAPFIKWAGGKRKLIPAFAPHFPPMQQVRRYFEPFLGGGAVFFHLQHPCSFLSDSNEELIEVYQVVKNNVEDLIQALQKHRNEETYYYEVRAQDPETLSPVERAARFIFLNKTCYNGLYRVNSEGQFNVPFGRYRNPLICDAFGLRAASLALRNAEIFAADFEAALANAEHHDFIYCDPPYHPVSETSSFTAYTADKFDISDQERLARVYRDLDRRGCYVMLSNSDMPFIRELYADFQIIEVQAPRAISSKADGRGKITELLIINY
ncbi:MAG: DNA adenine methylase [Chloroflexota bacterium]|nr:MAG: DNA adenine methylase [Chloroflexota bacterium]